MVLTQDGRDALLLRLQINEVFFHFVLSGLSLDVPQKLTIDWYPVVSFKTEIIKYVILVT